MGTGLLVPPSFCPDREPWEQQRGESRQAYAAWTAYRDMEEPRTYRRLAQDLDRSVTLIGGWGSKWRWQQRLAAYVAYIEKVRMAERISAIKEMDERHASVAKLGLEKVEAALNSINSLPPQALAKLLATSVDVERLARGASREMQHGNGRTDRSSLPMSQPETLNIVSEKIAKLSPIDRDLLRRLSVQHLKVITLEAELLTAENEEAIECQKDVPKD
jgi:hypothetical protein